MKLALALLVLLSARSEAFMGFNFPTWWKDTYAGASAQQSLAALAATGADSVALTPTWYMASRKASVLAPTDATASDDSLRLIMRRAKALGLRVVLKPHVDAAGGGPRALIRPADKEAWFASYRTFILHYASLATEEKADLFVVGTELAIEAAPWNVKRWKALIAEVRAVYSGPLTYAANWYDFAAIPFWGSLDYIGIDGYFPLAGGDSKFWLKQSLKAYLPAIEGVSAAFGKPVLFTEMGLASQKGAGIRPWDYGKFGDLDLEAQKAYFEAFLETFASKRYFAGLLQWGWETDPNAGGPADKTMTVQGKPALDVLKAYFKPKAAAPPADPGLMRRAAARALSVFERGAGF